MYEGNISFNIKCLSDESMQKIYISHINDNLMCIELPEIDTFDFEDIFLFSIHSITYNLNKSKLVTVKLPKVAKSLRLRDAFWVTQIKRLFVWDTTELDFTGIENYRGSMLEMIVVQSSTGGKPKIIKF